MKRLLIFASGTANGTVPGKATGGGSGFENLVIAQRKNQFSADIVGVVSSHEHGGVRTRADRLKVPFMYFSPPYTAERYLEIIARLQPDFIAFCGWLKMARGLDPRITVNIHPGPLPLTAGLYGDNVHRTAIAAYKAGKITDSAVSMHFVTQEYDAGPLFFYLPVRIFPEDDYETLAKRVKQKEHNFYPGIIRLLLEGLIHWDGKDEKSLYIPPGYRYLPNRVENGNFIY